MFTRRELVKSGVALVSLGELVPRIFRQGIALAQHDNSDMPERTLVVVQMAGGNDGLNTVVPYNDGTYHSIRPMIGFGADKVLKLNDTYGLHPAMTGMKQLWDAGQLAVVNGVGYPNPNYSHFAAMDIWQSANPNGTPTEGWVGKYLDAMNGQHNSLVGLNIGGSTPPEFRSNVPPVPSLNRIEDYALRPSADGTAQNTQRNTSVLQLYEMYPGEAKYGALLQGTVQDAFDSSVKLTSIVQSYKPAVTYPQTPVANGLKMIASALAANLGMRVAHIALGGFDTHSRQAADQAKLLGQLGDGLAAFYQDLAAHGRANNTVTMTWSEFGRRAGENASAGTDHGSAEPLFVVGGAVKGGLYGDYPSLQNLDAGNLRFTTDFRSVYATLLDQWLQADADAILGQHWNRLGFLNAA
ncbi:MAG: DUF1501 domain-containing protein [Dehalococcoidia bacterium]